MHRRGPGVTQPVTRSALARVLGIIAVAVACTVTAGCGSPPPPRAQRGAAEKILFEHDIEPSDIFPADLDLVVRVDVGRMRAGIGPVAADAMAKRALTGTIDDEVKDALACAEVVWVATRAQSLDDGDRIIVVEGKSCMPELLGARWEPVRSSNGKLRIFDRAGEPPRSSTARIMNLGNRATAFISPVELDPVRRVLAAGPDPKRGNPTAEGLVSFDLRAGRLPPALERKYPSIGAVLAGIERVRGSAVLVDDGVKIDADVLGASKTGAERAARFLEAMRDNLAKSTRFADLMKDVKVEQVAKTVQVRLTLPAKAVLALMADDGEKAK